MIRAAAAQPLSTVAAIPAVAQQAESMRSLFRQMLYLALPVLLENALHMVVGINDTYLANKLPKDAAAAGAAVGTITYLLWFFKLLVPAVGTGRTAIIAR